MTWITRVTFLTVSVLVHFAILAQLVCYQKNCFPKGALAPKVDQMLMKTVVQGSQHKFIFRKARKLFRAQNYISHEHSACDREGRLVQWPLVCAYYCRTVHAIAFPTGKQFCYLQLCFLCQQCGLGIREPALLTQHNLCNTAVPKVNPSSCQRSSSVGFTFHSAFTAQQWALQYCHDHSIHY